MEVSKTFSVSWDCFELLVAPSFSIYDPVFYICHQMICERKST